MTDATIGIADWTMGTEAIAFQTCDACASIWYVRRGFCPSCGSPGPRTRRASGRGKVHAFTRVCRAATAEARAHVPFTIVLVDAEEGFRLMAHGDAGLTIGDEVAVKFTRFTGRLVPYFGKI